jgi:hypothetical protein
MAASLTLHCLEKLSDYQEFERLCNGLLMLEEYPYLEPLGAYKDKGRDAINKSTSSGLTTIFAYSVRTDWQVKLAEDAKKIAKHNHICHELCFLTTGKVSASQRDMWIENIRNQYGWELKIRGAEWFKAMLDVKYPAVKSEFPSIFTPQILEHEKSLQIERKQKYVFISFAPEHRVLAKWIAQKLTVEGYDVWSHQLGLPDKASAFHDLESVVREESCCFIGLYTESSISNPELNILRSLATSLSKKRSTDFFIPLGLTDVDTTKVAAITSPLEPISFESWAQGWNALIQKVERLGCPRGLPRDAISASRVGFTDELILNSENSEIVVSNCSRILQIPQAIYRFKISNKFAKQEIEAMQQRWAFRLNKDREVLSFHHPPPDIKHKLNISNVGSLLWRDRTFVDDIYAESLISELLRKSFFVKCSEEGLYYCPDTKLQYFPRNLVKNDNLSFTKPDGSRSRVQCCGKRKYWRPSGAEEYCYFMSPNFYIQRDLFDQFSPILSIRYRLTDADGTPLPAKKRNSRRKHLCKSWWNDAWLNRSLAVFQFLANDEGYISIGSSEKETILIQATPLKFYAAVSVDEAALRQSKNSRMEILDTLDSSSEEEEA